MRLSAAVVFLALLFAATLAQAQVAPAPGLPDPDPSRCSRETPQFCLNGPSSSATALDSMRGAAKAPRDCSSASGRRNCQDSSAGGGLGLRQPLKVAAASGASQLLDAEATKWGIWGSYGYQKIEGFVPAAPYKSDLNNFRIGLDRVLGQRYVLGLAFTYEDLDSTTRFNGGNVDGSAYMFSPYFLWMLNDSVSVDLNGGIGRNHVTQNRLDPLTGQTIGAQFNGTRYFTSITLNAGRNFGPVHAGGRLGYLYAQENQNAYTEAGGPSALVVGARNLKLGQAFVGVDAAYSFNRNLEAYAALVYRQDVIRNDGQNTGGPPGQIRTMPTDRNGFDWTVGLRLFATRTVSGYAEYIRTFGRDEFRQQGVNLLVRFDI